MKEINNKDNALKILFKDFSKKHTVTSLSENMHLSRVGAWKLLKSLESEKLIILKKAGEGKTSVYFSHLNWKNPVLEKKISLLLLEESGKNSRWSDSFYSLKDKCEFLLIFGSILVSSKEAKDIDILCIAESKNFTEIQEIFQNIQKSQAKPIHKILFTKEEFISELKKQNKAFSDAVKKGAVLFGQDAFVNIIRRLDNE